jgi:beta-fructofuranosidase
MVKSTSLLSIVLGALPYVHAQNSSELQLPDVLTADYITALGNNSLFLRWRPSFHFISPAGWMNVRFHSIFHHLIY